MRNYSIWNGFYSSFLTTPDNYKNTKFAIKVDLKKKKNKEDPFGYGTITVPNPDSKNKKDPEILKFIVESAGSNILSGVNFTHSIYAEMLPYKEAMKKFSISLKDLGLKEKIGKDFGNKLRNTVIVRFIINSKKNNMNNPKNLGSYQFKNLNVYSFKMINNKKNQDLISIFEAINAFAKVQ